MQLSEEQKAVLADWVSKGLSLSDIQKNLESEFGVRMTYMDVRFLVDDMNLDVQSAAPRFDDPRASNLDSGSGAPGKVTVTLDKISRPDALVNGRVTFSDGVTAQWHLDRMGRLSLNANDPDYRPSNEDLEEFQIELSEAVKNSGMF